MTMEDFAAGDKSDLKKPHNNWEKPKKKKKKKKKVLAGVFPHILGCSLEMLFFVFFTFFIFI